MANWSNLPVAIVSEIACSLDFYSNSRLRNVCRNVRLGVRHASEGLYICVFDNTLHGQVVEYPATLRRWHGIFREQPFTFTTWYEMTFGLARLHHLQYVRMTLPSRCNLEVFQEYFLEYMESFWTRRVRVRVDFPMYLSLGSVLLFGHTVLSQYSCDLQLTYKGFTFTSFMITRYCIHGPRLYG